MRILFMHHLPLSQNPVGQLVRLWALALHAAGHEPRLFVADSRVTGNDAPLQVERIVCRQGDSTADVPFDPPRFSTPKVTAPGVEFGALSAQELAQYRDRLRRRLDSQIERFDPQVIHAQHIWIGGQLALETGVPYVLSAWGPELIDYPRLPNYQALADQAAENAGRILAPSDAVRRQVSEQFPAVEDRLEVMPQALKATPTGDRLEDPDKAVDHLIGIYQQVLDARFGV